MKATHLGFVYNGQNLLRLVRKMTDEDLAEIALRIAEIEPEIFAGILAGQGNHLFTINDHVITILPAEMRYLQSQQDKIVAIKWIREKYGLGLREAKDLSETLVKQGYVNRPTWIPYPFHT